MEVRKSIDILSQNEGEVKRDICYDQKKASVAQTKNVKQENEIQDF